MLKGDDEGALSDAALRYLDRYDATKSGLRRVLERKLDPALTPVERRNAQTNIEALISRLETSRVLNDARYAENMTQSLRARGASARGIAQKLRQRGVEASVLEERSGDPGDELRAARTFARKKRLVEKHLASGPAGRSKALGALARQGFSFDVARRALELEAGTQIEEGDETGSS